MSGSFYIIQPNLVKVHVQSDPDLACLVGFYLNITWVHVILFFLCYMYMVLSRSEVHWSGTTAWRGFVWRGFY